MMLSNLTFIHTINFKSPQHIRKYGLIANFKNSVQILLFALLTSVSSLEVKAIKKRKKYIHIFMEQIILLNSID